MGAELHQIYHFLNTHSGKVYRGGDLVQKFKDASLSELVSKQMLMLLAPDLYYVPKKSVFGEVPPDDHEVVSAFLQDDDFLVFFPSTYNSLGLGTTQLYNKTLVYNHKKSGLFTFGGRQFEFRVVDCFPQRLTSEFLLVDLLNNLDDLAEDKTRVLQMAQQKLFQLNLKQSLAEYGSVATKKHFEGWLNA